MAKSTSEYYKKNPEARRKRLKQQARYNRKSMQIKKRVELNRKTANAELTEMETEKMYLIKKMDLQSLKKHQRTELGTVLGNDTATAFA